MNRSKFIILLEQFWVDKYGSDWARGDVFWNDLIEAATKLGAK